jgi:hypothetical protein
MKLEEAYAKNVAIRKSNAAFGELAPYGWIESPKQWPFEYMAYSQMLEEHSMELANSVNQLRGFIGKLSAWGDVLAECEEDELNRQIVMEFVDPLATVAINLPYVIRSRFIYSVAHLCHQANRAKLQGWKDDFPLDSEIYFGEADRHGQHWKRYGKLKLKLQGISSKKYADETLDFRNKYNHRYSPRIEHGLTGLVVRQIGKDGRVSYVFGQTEPLKVKRIVELLKEQYHACMGSFVEYQKLVQDQISAVFRTAINGSMGSE